MESFLFDVTISLKEGDWKLGWTTLNESNSIFIKLTKVIEFEKIKLKRRKNLAKKHFIHSETW